MCKRNFNIWRNGSSQYFLFGIDLCKICGFSRIIIFRNYLFHSLSARFEFTIYSSAITITKNVTNSKALCSGLTDKKQELFWKGGPLWSHSEQPCRGAAALWNFSSNFPRKSFHAKILGVFHAEDCSPRGTTIDVNFLMVSRVIFYTLECCLRNMGKLDALRSAKQSEPKRKCEFLKSLLMLLEFQSHISDICIVGAQLGLKSVA